MKIHSIKFKITLLLVVTVTCLVAMLIGFNSIFSEKVYMNRKQKSMINSYENVNEIMQKYTDSQIDKDTMCADMENISTAKGISVLVVDSSWCTIYVSTQGDDSMMERLRMSIFNGDIFKNNGSRIKHRNLRIRKMIQITRQTRMIRRSIESVWKILLICQVHHLLRTGQS